MNGQPDYSPEVLSTRLYEPPITHTIHLQFLNLEIGNSVEILITHDPCCQPVIINPEILLQGGT